MSEINTLLSLCAEIVNEEIIKALAYLGEKCVTRVRDRSQSDSWIDHTQNLRNSIGYAVINEGRKIIESAFAFASGGQEGPVAGKNLIESLVKVYSEVFALIVVAGMNYAEKVEAMDNKVVLAECELWARSVMQEHINKAINKAMKRIEALTL